MDDEENLIDYIDVEFVAAEEKVAKKLALSDALAQNAFAWRQGLVNKRIKIKAHPRVYFIFTDNWPLVQVS